MNIEQKIMQCHLCKEHCPQAETAREIANGRMYATKELIACQKKLEEYRAIGTVEECREAVEAWKKNKPKLQSSTEKTHYKCPNCGMIVLTEYKDGYKIGHKPAYCEKCGTHIDWSDE